MRKPLITILTFFTYGSPFVQAVPGSHHARTIDSPRGDPRNTGAYQDQLAPIHRDTVIAERIPALDHPHISDFQLDDRRSTEVAERSLELGHSRINDNHLDVPRDTSLSQRDPATPPPTNPRPGKTPTGSKPPPGAPRYRTLPAKYAKYDTYESRKTLAFGTNRNDLIDETDVTSVYPCRDYSKRDVAPEYGILEERQMASMFKALTWEQWQDTLRELDEEIGQLEMEHGENYGPVNILLVGGISAIAHGSRGKDGKTGDIDYAFRWGTPDKIRVIFPEAITRVILRNPDRYNPWDPEDPNSECPINNNWETFANDAELREELSKNSNRGAFRGPRLSADHADFEVQIMGKIERMAQWRMGGQIKTRDQQDAQKFLELIKDGNDDELRMEDFIRWGAKLGKSASDVRYNVIGAIRLVVGDGLPGVEQAIKDQVAQRGC